MRHSYILCFGLLIFVTILHSSHGFFFTQKYKGTLSPVDPEHVCVAQPIPFTCTLESEPVENKTILFYVNDIRADEADVSVVNETVSIFNAKFNTTTQYQTVKCYYFEGDTVSAPSRSYQIGVTSSVKPTNATMPNLTDFNCIVYNYVDSLNCSWKYEGIDSHQKGPHVDFKWQIQTFSGWNDCYNLNTDYNYCYFGDSGNGDFTTRVIVVNITLSYNCWQDNVTKTYQFPVDTRTNIKPHPVSDLTSEVINSTCIKLNWNTKDSKPSYKITQGIQVSSEWGKYEVQFNTTYKMSAFAPHNYTLCNLEEYTDYTFEVKIKPLGILYAGFWSDPKFVRNKTLSAVPGASPEVAIGGYAWNPQSCQNNRHTRNVCFLMKRIDPIQVNGDFRGLRVQYNISHTDSGSEIHHGSTSTLIAQDSVSFCQNDLLCGESYNVYITPYNDAGDATKSSHIAVIKYSPGIIQPTLRVERVNTSVVHLKWSNPIINTATGYHVFYCEKSEGACKQNGDVEWDSFDKDTREIYKIVDVNSPELAYGVSLITETGSSGLQWETCVYAKGVCPTKTVKNVAVSTGSVDDTLVVIWDKLPCQPGQPYINSYAISYCRVSDGVCMETVVGADYSRVVLYSLQADEKYSVKVKGLNAADCAGPVSDLVYGIPEHKALRSGEIVGIAMAVLLVVLLAAVGVAWGVRTSRQRLRTFKTKASAIIIPEGMPDNLKYSYSGHDNKSMENDPDDEIGRNHKFNRQESDDSGVPQSPKENDKPPEYRVNPDGYCVADIIKEEDNVDINENFKPTTTTTRPVVPDMTVGYVTNNSTGHIQMDPSAKNVAFKRSDENMKNTHTNSTASTTTTIPHDYNKATLHNSNVIDDSQSRHDNNPSNIGEHVCPPITVIPKPVSDSCSGSGLPEYFEFSKVNEDDTGISKSASNSDSKTLSEYNSGSQCSDKTTASYVLARQSSDVTSQIDLASNPYVTMPDQTADNILRSNSPVQPTNISVSGQMNSHVSSQSGNSEVNPLSPQISDYVTSATKTGGCMFTPAQNYVTNSAENDSGKQMTPQIADNVLTETDVDVNKLNAPQISNFAETPVVDATIHTGPQVTGYVTAVSETFGDKPTAPQCLNFVTQSEVNINDKQMSVNVGTPAGQMGNKQISPQTSDYIMLPSDNGVNKITSQQNTIVAPVKMVDQIQAFPKMNSSLEEPSTHRDVKQTPPQISGYVESIQAMRGTKLTSSEVSDYVRPPTDTKINKSVSPISSDYISSPSVKEGSNQMVYKDDDQYLPSIDNAAKQLLSAQVTGYVMSPSGLEDKTKSSFQNIDFVKPKTENDSYKTLPTQISGYVQPPTDIGGVKPNESSKTIETNRPASTLSSQISGYVQPTSNYGVNSKSNQQSDFVKPSTVHYPNPPLLQVSGYVDAEMACIKPVQQQLPDNAQPPVDLDKQNPSPSQVSGYVMSPLQYDNDNSSEHNSFPTINKDNNTYSTFTQDNIPNRAGTLSEDSDKSETMSSLAVSTTTPYVDASKMAMLNNANINPNICNSPNIETEHRNTETVTAPSGYVTLDTLNENNRLITPAIAPINLTITDYVDASRMTSIPFERATSEISNSSEDSAKSEEKDRDDTNKNRHNSDSGLSSIELDEFATNPIHDCKTDD